MGLAYAPSQLAYPVLIIVAALVMMFGQIDGNATLMVTATIGIFAIILIWQEMAMRLRMDARIFENKAAYETRTWITVAVPLLLAGGNKLGFKHGRLHEFIGDTKVPLANLFVSMLNAVDVPIEKLADSTGKMSQLMRP